MAWHPLMPKTFVGRLPSAVLVHIVETSTGHCLLVPNHSFDEGAVKSKKSIIFVRQKFDIMTEKMILSEIHQLPESLKLEVFHFIAFLKKEYAQKENRLTTVPNNRIFGISKGKYILAEDFDAPLEDFNDYM